MNPPFTVRNTPAGPQSIELSPEAAAVLEIVR
jgi:hypothetical protein